MLGQIKKALRNLFSLRLVQLFFIALALLVVIYFVYFYFPIAKGWEVAIAGVLAVGACLGIIWAAKHAP